MPCPLQCGRVFIVIRTHYRPAERNEREINMGKTKIALSGILLFATALMTLSCASPMRLTDNWRNSAYTGPAFTKIMVVALTKQHDLRQPIENEFAKQLRSRGVEVATCHESFPDPDKATREELVRVSQGMGIEAYLIVRVLGTGTDVVTSGPTDTTMQFADVRTMVRPRAGDDEAARSGNLGVEALRRENDEHRLAIHRRCRQPYRKRRPDLPVRQPGGEDPSRQKTDPILLTIK